VGVHGNADIGEDASEAYVQLGYNGTATIFLCVAEHGTGQKSNYLKMVAEVLQMPPERISMTPADSLVTLSSSDRSVPEVPMPLEALSSTRRKTQDDRSLSWVPVNWARPLKTSIQPTGWYL